MWRGVTFSYFQSAADPVVSGIRIFLERYSCGEAAAASGGGGRKFKHFADRDEALRVGGFTDFSQMFHLFMTFETYTDTKIEKSETT